MSGFPASLIALALIDSLVVSRLRFPLRLFHHRSELQQIFLLGLATLCVLLFAELLYYPTHRLLLDALDFPLLNLLFDSALLVAFTLGLSVLQLHRWPARLAHGHGTLVMVAVNSIVISRTVYYFLLPQGLLQTLICMLLTGGGLFLVLAGLAALRQRVALAAAPERLRGWPVEFLSLGLAVMALWALARTF